MTSRATTAVVVGLVLAVGALAQRPAAAADRRIEGAGRSALDKAANDYLATSYAKGAARLKKALRACGTSKCSPGTRAALLRDIGTMQFRGGDLGAAKKSWAEAIRLQADIRLNPSYDAPDVRAAWNELEGGTGSGTRPGGATTGATSADAHGDAADGSPGPQPTGDFAHAPVAEQHVDTPVPIYAEYSGSSALARVVVKYRGAGAADWSRLELKRLARGWAGQIPCADVTRGTLRYWIQGFDGGGDPVASSGDPEHAYGVPIRDEIAIEAPHLPGQPPPAACGPDAAGSRDGASAKLDATSPDGAPDHAPTVATTYARFWIGVSGEAPELLRLPGGNDLCKLTPQALPASSAGYYCTNPDGTDFPDRATPEQNSHLTVQGKAGNLDGGFVLGDVRVMLSLDYALSASFLLGARVGYVLDAYPGQAAVNDGKAFAPRIHLEARATYLFGREPLAHAGFAPMVFLGLGAAEFDGHAGTFVTLDNVAGQQPVNAWLTDGPFFAALGLGFRCQLSRHVAFTAAARANAVVGGNGFLLTYGPEVGAFYGF